jgi:hypothetical protein
MARRKTERDYLPWPPELQVYDPARFPRRADWHYARVKAARSLGRNALHEFWAAEAMGHPHGWVCFVGNETLAGIGHTKAAMLERNGFHVVRSTPGQTHGCECRDCVGKWVIGGDQ